MQPALELVDSLAELEEALKNPDAFFKKVLQRAGPAARRMLIAQLRPPVEPVLHDQGLQWSDVQPLLESVDSQKELQQALKDPASFLKKLLAGAGGQVARKMLLIKVKPVVEPYLQQQGVIWVDVQPALELIASLRQLEEALSNPQVFFKKLLQEGGPVAKRMLIPQLRPCVEPRVLRQGLQWSDVRPMLESIDSLD